MILELSQYSVSRSCSHLYCKILKNEGITTRHKAISRTLLHLKLRTTTQSAKKIMCLVFYLVIKTWINIFFIFQLNINLVTEGDGLV